MNENFRFLMYRSSEQDISVNAVIRDETVWLTLMAMAELFGCTPDNISLDLKNIFADGDLEEGATAEDFSVVQREGARQVKRKTKFYNLDAIISVGYRINPAERPTSHLGHRRPQGVHDQGLCPG